MLVDDGSTDKTFSIATALVADLPGQAEVVRLKANRGKAEAIRVGIRRSLRTAAQFVAYWDADLSSPLTDLDRLIDRAQPVSTWDHKSASRLKYMHVALDIIRYMPACLANRRHQRAQGQDTNS